jgi:hypothetical protein
MSKVALAMVLAILYSGALAQGAADQGALDQSGLVPERAEFVIGNGYFVLLHELAHVIIHDFEVPVLGNEEDAADTLAATTLLRFDQRAGGRRFARMLVMAADANRIFWQLGLELANQKAAYWANHPLSVQRAMRITCLVVGSDPAVFSPLADMVEMPLSRSDWCEEEYAAAESARAWVHSTYVNSPETAEASVTPGYEYRQPRDPEHQDLLALIKEEQLLERAAEFVRREIVLPDELILSARSCGVPDAYWDGSAREIVMCYELLQAFYNLSADQEVQALEQRLREIHASK